MPILKPSVRDDLEGGAEPETLFERYGTHYLAKAVIGARASHSSSTNTTRFSSSLSDAAAAEMHYKGLVGSLDAAAKAKYQNDLESFSKASKVQVRVRGGIEAYGRNIAQAGAYDKWLGSVDDRPVFIDFAPDSLRPQPGPVRGRRAACDLTRRLRGVRTLKAEPGGAVHRADLHVPPSLSARLVSALLGRPRQRADLRPRRCELHAHRKPVEGAMPIDQYVARNPRRYCYSPDSNAGRGWMRQDVAFHAYVSGGPDGWSIYRHYASSPAWRFYYEHQPAASAMAGRSRACPFYGCKID